MAFNIRDRRAAGIKPKDNCQAAKVGLDSRLQAGWSLYRRLAELERPARAAEQKVSGSAREGELMKQAEYLLYLQSPKWKALREKVIKRYKGKCAVCGQPGSETHHINYRRLGRERLYQLLWLCADCHDAWHQKLGSEN